MNVHRLIVLVLSPLLFVVGLLSVLLGMAVFVSDGGMNAVLTANLDSPGGTVAPGLYLLLRLALLPCQVVFILLVSAAALWTIRRRQKIARWATGEPVALRLTTAYSDLDALPSVIQPVIRPARRRTVQQIISSLVVVLALGTAFLLSLSQFIPVSELAVVVTALTGSLAWGARLPIGDLLGGISNLFEVNFSIGDRIRYTQQEKVIEGDVEAVDLRYAAVRTDSGELVTIPNGELRVLRNYSRGNKVSVYVTFPMSAYDLPGALTLLQTFPDQLARDMPGRMEIVQVMSTEGRLAPVVDITLFAQTRRGQEDGLDLALFDWLHQQLTRRDGPSQPESA